MNEFDYGQYAYFGVVFARKTGREKVKRKKHGVIGWASCYDVTRIGNPADENGHKRVMVILDGRSGHPVWVSLERFKQNKKLRRKMYHVSQLNSFASRGVKCFKSDFCY